MNGLHGLWTAQCHDPLRKQCRTEHGEDIETETPSQYKSWNSWNDLVQ